MSRIARAIAAVVAFAAVAAAAIVFPAFATDAPPERTRPTALEGSGLTWCGDVQQIYAPPDAYRDRPVYVANEQPMQKIRKWARTQPGYEDLWIDRDHLGWLTLAFSQDSEARQADLLRLFPDDGVVAVPVEHTRRELRRLQRRVVDTLRPTLSSFGVGVDVTANVVDLSVPAVTQELVASLEAAFAGEPLCVDGADPTELPLPGPQPLAGDGWIMAGFEEGDGPPYRTGVATDAGALAQLWEDATLEGEPPAADFDERIAVWFSMGHGSSCPNLRLDGVTVDHDGALVYPLLVDPDASMMCTDDLAGSWQFIVLLDRDRLPAGPFTVQLGPEPLVREQTVVEVDLTTPGTVAPEGTIHGAPRGQEPARSGVNVETIGSTRYAMDVSCGIGYLGVVNDLAWVTDEGAMPAAWLELIDGDELVFDIELRTRPAPHVTATAGGVSVRYEPTPDGPPPCDA